MNPTRLKSEAVSRKSGKGSSKLECGEGVVADCQVGLVLAASVSS